MPDKIPLLIWAKVIVAATVLDTTGALPQCGNTLLGRVELNKK